MALIVHNFFFYLVFLPFTLLASTAVLVLSLFPGTSRVCQELEKRWAQLALRLSPVQVQAEIAPEAVSGNCILIANHQSQLDIPLLIALMPRQTIRFLAKDTLFRIPFFGWAMAKLGHIPISRENHKEGMRSIDRAAGKARDGRTLCIFPEGTRHRELGPFKIGGIVLAMKSGLPIVPVVINGTKDAHPKGSPWLFRRTVFVRVLPPFPTQRYDSLKERHRLKTDLWQYMNNRFLETEQWLKKTTRPG